MSAKYHPGEIEVQKRAGVRPMAERVGNSIHSTIPHAARGFLEEQLMVVVGSVDADGRVWASLLVSEPGFARVLDERTVRIDATPLPGDPRRLTCGRCRDSAPCSQDCVQGVFSKVRLTREGLLRSRVEHPPSNRRSTVLPGRPRSR